MSSPSLSFEKKWQKRFEKFAQNSTEAQIAGWSEGGLQTRVQAFQRHWDPTLPGLWCDIGCGAGTYLNILKQAKMQTIGLDYSLPTLIQAKSRVDGDVHWGQVDVQAMAFKPKVFNGILCFGVLQALTTPHQALQQCFNVLKSDGQLWVDALNKHCIITKLSQLKDKLQNNPERLKYLGKKELQKLLLQVGFSKVDCHFVFILPGRFKLLNQIMLKLRVNLLIERIPFFNAWLCHSILFVAKR